MCPFDQYKIKASKPITPGTAGGPGGRDQAVKSFFVKKYKLPKKIFVCIYLLVMPKYWGKQIFTHGRFPEVGQKQKTEKKRKKEKKRSRSNDSDNNGQATHGARKHAWGTQAAWAKIKKPLVFI